MNFFERKNYNFNRISSFILLTTVLISSNYISQILSCDLRNLLQKSIYFRHIIGILLIFVFIMVEGGWSFHTELDQKFPNDWSSADTIDSLIVSFVLYCLFLISTKTTLIYNLLWLATIFVLYCINTQRVYWLKRDFIDMKTNQIMFYIEFVLFFLMLIFLICGIVDYYFKHMKKYKNFDFIKYFFHVQNCKY